MRLVDLVDVVGEALVARMGWTLVHTMWQGVVIAVLLVVVLRALRNASAQARYVACCCALGMLVMAPVATFVVLTRMEADRGASSLAPSPTMDMSPTAMDLTPIDVTIAPAPATAPLERAHALVLRCVVVVWAIGVVAMALYHIAGWVWLWRLRRGPVMVEWQDVLQRLQKQLRVTRRVLMIESARIDVPAVIGVLRPMIVVPIGVFSGLSPVQAQAILAHELAHIRRHDYLVNLLQAAVETVMFYHPAAWWISGRIRAERENCCDDIASGVCGDGAVYASALAALEERRGPVARARAGAGALAPAATGGELLNRVRRILKLPPARTSRRISIRSLAAAGLAIACVVLPLVVNAQTKEKSDPPAETTERTEEISPITDADLQVTVEDYKIGAGDLLNVSITDLVGPGVETVKSVRVSDSGVISMPLVGAVKLVGLTQIEAEKTIQKAYRDASLIPNAQVSVAVTDARQRRFAVVGDVDKPGEYAMPTADYRLLEALTQAGVRDTGAGSVRIVRAGNPKRVIEVPLKKLLAGDASVNVVIRPGDIVLAAPQPKEFVKVVVGRESLVHEGKPITLAELRAKLEALSEPRRRNTVLEVAAADKDVTVERFFAATGELSQMVKDLGLAYLSQTGIAAAADGAAPAAPPPVDPDYRIRTGDVLQIAVDAPGQRDVVTARDVRVRDDGTIQLGLHEMKAAGLSVAEFEAALEKVCRDKKLIDMPKARVTVGATGRAQRTGTPRAVERFSGDEIFISGSVGDAGAYSIAAGQKLNVKQAIAAAGGVLHDLPDTTVSVIRRDNGNDVRVLDSVLVSALMSGEAKDVDLQAGDIVRVDGPPSGEYYIQGRVQRSGVYSLTGRKITVKQALAAAGGLEEGTPDDALVSVLRRQGTDQHEYVLRNVRISDLLSGKQKDEFLMPNDIVRVGHTTVVRPATMPAATAPSSAAPDDADGLLKKRDELRNELKELGDLGTEHPTRKRVQRMLHDVEVKIAQRAAELTVEKIAAVDATMRQYLQTKEQMEFNLARSRQKLGPENRIIKDLEADLALQQRRIDAYAAEFRKHFD